MYTPEMSTAFHAITPPKNFGVVLMDNDDYINLMINPEEFLELSQEDQVMAVDYVNNVKKALEANGAIVQVIRETIQDD